jgi:hypothetical protein
MKQVLILITVLLLVCTSAQAGWFSKSPDPTLEYKEKITVLENQLSAQNRALNNWQIATGSLAAVSVLLFVIGTSLGSITRKHYGTGRMGRNLATTPASPNGTKPQVIRKQHQRNGVAALET